MAKQVKRPTKSKRPIKSKKSKIGSGKGAKPTARDQKVRERIHQSGNFPNADEALLSIMLEIDAETNQGPPLKLGEVSARIAMAKRSFEDAILSGDDDLKHWIEAARRAAKL
jgi:hypothetical protein